MDIIVDIDGVLSNCEHRLPLIRTEGMTPNWDAFFDACSEDAPIPVTIDIVQQLMTDTNTIVFVTGRPERIRDKTMAWLTNSFDEAFGHGVHLMMRKDGDHRPSAIVKQEMLSSMRQLGFTPEVAFEDRKADADMYRQEGLVVYQVAEGAF